MRITENEQNTRRKRMIYTAYKLFCEYGIDNVSVPQIAKAADVSRNSIFRYFKNKIELVQATQLLLWEEIRNYILLDSKQELIHAKNGLEKIEIIICNFKHLCDNHSGSLLFSRDYKLFIIRNHIVLSIGQHENTMSPIFSLLCSIINEGQNDGSIKKTENIMKQFLTFWGILYSYLEEIVIYDRMYEGENPWNIQFDSVVQLIIKALQ